jgi:hypothetical protein
MTMFARHSKRPLSLLPLLALLLLGVGCPGCKPGARVKAERLAQRVRDERDSVNKLRQWFTELQSRPHSANDEAERIPIPRSLGSEWWRKATASATWADDGGLATIIVTEDFFEFITIGPPSATPESLHLTGQPPTFHAKIADGMYVWIRYK